MNYGKINKHDIANGTGVRVSLFVSGCPHKCKGCFNPETWDYEYGEKFMMKHFIEICEELQKDHIDGLTILGGEPLAPQNINRVTQLCALARRTIRECERETGKKKTIWLYTGYNFEDFKYDPIMHYVDVVVDGRFIESKKDISLKFRGSSNQRIIDVQATLKNDGEVVLLEV